MGFKDDSKWARRRSRSLGRALQQEQEEAEDEARARAHAEKRKEKTRSYSVAASKRDRSSSKSRRSGDARDALDDVLRRREEIEMDAVDLEREVAEQEEGPKENASKARSEP